MKKEFRIKKTQEIESVIKENKSVNSLEMRFFVKKVNETSHFRYAISVGKKIGDAHIRNKEKRRLRSLFQKYQNIIPEGILIFVVAKPKILELDYQKLDKQFLYLLKKSLNKIKGENSEIIFTPKHI